MEKKLLRFSLICATGVILLTANPERAMATELGVAGFTHDKDNVATAQTGSNNSIITTLSEDDIPIPGFNDIGIANVETNLMIREGPGENEKILGKLPKNGGCKILEADNGSGWTLITSGKCTGYVKSEFLIIGEEASKLAFEIASRIATSTVDGLNVREYPSTDDNIAILDCVAKGEELIVLDQLVVTYDDEYSKWVKVSLDSDDENGTVGFVAKEYVELSYALKNANTLEELTYGAGVSSLRINLIDKARDYLGYSYVWGGNSLTNGVDCSGFTQQIYQRFDIFIPRTSKQQGASGTKISASNIKPGDLVFYGSGSTISHVAIYIGNGKIIHASNRRDGIKISNMYYRNPIKCVRYIND